MPTEDNDRKRRLLQSEEETQGKYKPLPVEPPAPTTAKYYRPRLDDDNMPLPRRVDELDMDGTRVSPVAYEPPSKPRKAQVRLAPRSQPPRMETA